MAFMNTAISEVSIRYEGATNSVFIAGFVQLFFFF